MSIPVENILATNIFSVAVAKALVKAGVIKADDVLEHINLPSTAENEFTKKALDKAVGMALDLKPLEKKHK